MESTAPTTAYLTTTDTRPANLDILLKEYTKRSNSLTMEDRMCMMDLRIKAISEMKAILSGEFLTSIVENYKNSPLGFMTDERAEDKARNRPAVKYKDEQVRDCIIEALLSGLNVSDNEFNVIGGRMYATKGGFAALISRDKKFSDLKIDVKIPVYTKASDGSFRAAVKFSATWKYNGMADAMLDHEVPIRVNLGMGDDAVLGKAYRKIYSRIYSQATGSPLTDGDATEAVMMPISATVTDVPKVSKKTVATTVDVKPAPPPPPAHTAAELTERITKDGLTVQMFEVAATKADITPDGVTINTASQAHIDAMYASYDDILANVF